jgi:hypothetical protein
MLASLNLAGLQLPDMLSLLSWNFVKEAASVLSRQSDTVPDAKFFTLMMMEQYFEQFSARTSLQYGSLEPLKLSSVL